MTLFIFQKQESAVARLASILRRVLEWLKSAGYLAALLAGGNSMIDLDKKVEIYVKKIALGIAENRAKYYHKQMIQAEISAHTLREELKVLNGEDEK